MDASQLGPIKDRPWTNAEGVPSADWKCGYCGNEVGSNTGYRLPPSAGPEWFIRICPSCNAPTFFSPSDHSPRGLPGGPVEHLPADLAALFAEARAAIAAGAPTAAVLACRKMLMHIAVDAGAEKNDSFLHYVEYLAAKGYVPPSGKTWVDYIRTKGNEANHEIVVMTSEEGRALVLFVEMLLRFIYELPALVPPIPAGPAP
jgi:hypothetical protein